MNSSIKGVKKCIRNKHCRKRKEEQLPFFPLPVFTFRHILSWGATMNPLPLICVGGLADIFTPDALPDRTLCLIQVGDQNRGGPDLGTLVAT